MGAGQGDCGSLQTAKDPAGGIIWNHPLSLVLDAGGLIAIERAHQYATWLVKRELVAGREPLTHGGALGQVWRGGSGRQTNLARLLPSIDVVSLDASLGQRAGILLGRTRMVDVVDAAL